MEGPSPPEHKQTISGAGAPTPGKPPFEVGEVLEGNFELQRILGLGGMGAVYDAHDRFLNRQVAIKAPTNPAFTPYLHREAQAMAAIRHQAIVTVHGHGAHRGVSFIVMERIYGKSLESHLEGRRLTAQRFSIAEALDILIALGEGLHAIHAAGISHQDIKPANIMLAPRSRVVLLDLGLFRPDFDTEARKTMAGSPGYMAPEVVTCEIRGGEGHLADMYSFGVVAFELLTHRLPFDGDSLTSLFANQLASTPAAVSDLRPDVPPALSAVIGQLLARQPHDRPSLEEILWRLRAVPARTATSTKTFSVLIVDDDVDLTDLLSASIEESMPGAVVRVVPSAERAIESVHQLVPDVMLLDLDLPGMNGIELAMYLRGTHLADRVRIIAMSSCATGEDLALFNQLGVTRFLPKGASMLSQMNIVLADVQRKIALARSLPPPRLDSSVMRAIAGSKPR